MDESKKIILELTLDELKTLDKYVEYCEETKEFFEKLKNAYPQPKMEYQESGTVDKVEYNGHTYLRIVYNDPKSFGGVWWKQIERHKSPMNIVTDDETRNILEGLWYNQVKKDESTKPMDEVVERLVKKYQAQKLWNILKDYGFADYTAENICQIVEDWLPSVERGTTEEEKLYYSRVEELYKEWWGQYPELETDSKYDDIRWQGFQAGYELAQLKDSCPEPPDEPEHYDEIEHDMSENVENKTIRQVIDRWWTDTFTSKNQWDVDTCIDDLADQVQFWIMRNKK
jgi:hypothetical protein